MRLLTCAICGNAKPTKSDQVICADCRAYRRKKQKAKRYEIKQGERVSA